MAHEALETDGVDGIIAAFLQAEHAGKDPDRADWLTRYPKFRGELNEFFADHDHVNEMASPFRILVNPVPASQGLSAGPSQLNPHETKSGDAHPTGLDVGSGKPAK